jgi:hypothetical protein
MKTDPATGDTTILGVPLNRVVAFLGPYISVASGVAASWLLVNVHLLGLFHVQHDGLASAIAQGAVLLLVSGLPGARELAEAAARDAEALIGPGAGVASLPCR